MASSTDFTRSFVDVWRKTLTPSESTSLAFSMAAVSSPACFWRMAHSLALVSQSCFTSARYFSSAARVSFVSDSAVSALWSSSSEEDLDALGEHLLGLLDGCGFLPGLLLAHGPLLSLGLAVLLHLGQVLLIRREGLLRLRQRRLRAVELF